MSRFYVTTKSDRNGLFCVKDKKNECAYMPFFYSYKGAVTYCNWLISNFEKSEEKRYVEFVNLYNSGKVSVNNIMKNLGLTERGYKKLRKLAISRGHLDVNVHNSSNSYDNVKTNKHYYASSSGRYRVSKIIDGKTIDFGTYSTKEDAKFVARRLEKVGWDKSELSKILDDLRAARKNRLS